MTEDEDILSQLYLSVTGNKPDMVNRLAGSGSARVYYRIAAGVHSFIGASNDDIRENQAFFSFSRHFSAAGLPVPALVTVHSDNRHYLIEDLGDTTLYQKIVSSRQQTGIMNENIGNLYQQVLEWLPVFQVSASAGIDYSVCYPREAFDRRSMMWDLNYFKYYYLKLARIPFDEQALEDDFQAFCDFLLNADHHYFMYRDFQSRNIMIAGDKPFFIDYQGGRKGPLQYDVASLLYDAKADMPDPMRTHLLDTYLSQLEKVCQYDRERFLRHFYGFVLIRILQALGAYGFRGYYENKPHFLQSIPYALRNLSHLYSAGRLNFGLPALQGVIETMINSRQQVAGSSDTAKLSVKVQSFSYKKSIPDDPSGNGGGFVFDCRALPNPGRNESFRHLSGLDQPVIDFLKREPQVDEFLNHAMALVDSSVKNYLSRDFENLMVSFGCTGGQHRSVFCAEEMASFLRSKYNIPVVVIHTEIENWKKDTNS